MPSELLEGTSEVITLFVAWQGKKSWAPCTGVTEQILQALVLMSWFSAELILVQTMVAMWRAKGGIKIITTGKHKERQIHIPAQADREKQIQNIQIISFLPSRPLSTKFPHPVLWNC